MTTNAQFDGKQFAPESVASAVVDQYDDELTRKFYRIVMGGGGADIHYGIFKTPEFGVKESAEATTAFMMDMTDWTRPLGPDSYVLDLGSGHGGCTHALVQRFGCKVMGFNIGPQQNAENLETCGKLGIADRVEVTCGNMNDGLPEDWTGAFDVVFSSEVLCHAGDKAAVMRDIYRVLKPGGALCFTDIMGADGADEAALKDFTDRNATTVMGRPSSYMKQIADAGLKYVAWVDLSWHLETYFRKMLSQVNDNRQEMLAEGMTDKYLDNWVKSLTERADIQADKGVFAWGVFTARKPQ